MGTVTRVRSLPFQAHGDFIAEWPVTGVNRGTSLAAVITELDAAGQPFVGAASMEVQNVAPRDNGEVHLLCHVEWPVDLSLRLDLLTYHD
jgi:hypothetical protein